MSKVVKGSLGWGQLEWRVREQYKRHGRRKTVRSRQLPEWGYKRQGEGLNLGKERMVGSDKFNSGHIDFKFPVWDLGAEPSRQLEMWSGERLDKDLGVSHREVRVEAVGWDHQGKNHVEGGPRMNREETENRRGKKVLWKTGEIRYIVMRNHRIKAYYLELKETLESNLFIWQEAETQKG